MSDISCPISTSIVAEHPVASVMVTVTVPTGRFVTVAVTSPVDQSYVNGATPPVAVNCAIPFEAVHIAFCVLTLTDRSHPDTTRLATSSSSSL